MSPCPQSPVWTSLEIVKLFVACLTPIAVAVIGLLLSKAAKKYEFYQWRNQRLIDKRIDMYSEIAPILNDLLCYFTFVGTWKDFTPAQIIKLKRDIDKKIYLASPLFSKDFHAACMDFINLCFDTFQGWGLDATLRTSFHRRAKALGEKWDPDWDGCFSENISELEDIREAYSRVMNISPLDRHR